jgi:hypothetical protein
MRELLTVSCLILLVGCSKSDMLKKNPKTAAYRYSGTMLLKYILHGQEFQDSVYNTSIYANEDFKRNTIRIVFDTTYGPFTKNNSNTYYAAYKGDTVKVDIRISDNELLMKRVTKITANESRLEEFKSAGVAINYEY